MAKKYQLSFFFQRYSFRFFNCRRSIISLAPYVIISIAHCINTSKVPTALNIKVLSFRQITSKKTCNQRISKSIFCTLPVHCSFNYSLSWQTRSKGSLIKKFFSFLQTHTSRFVTRQLLFVSFKSSLAVIKVIIK